MPQQMEEVLQKCFQEFQNTQTLDSESLQKCPKMFSGVQNTQILNSESLQKYPKMFSGVPKYTNMVSVQSTVERTM